MKRTIFAVVFCLAAAGTAVAADASLAGLIQAGNRDAALKEIAYDAHKGYWAHHNSLAPNVL